MVLSDKWSSPSLTYCWVSSMTIPEPLSALFMTMVWSDCSSLRAASCKGVKFVFVLRGCNSFMSFPILVR